MPLLDNMTEESKVQWFSLWYETRISLSYHPNRSLVDHNLDISSPMILAPTTSLCTPSKLVGSYYRISVVVRRFYLASKVSSWPQIGIFQVYPQGEYLMLSSRLESRRPSAPLRSLWLGRVEGPSRATFPLEQAVLKALPAACTLAREGVGC